MADNRLLEMLPAYYGDIKEFRELTKTQSKELDNVDQALQQVEDDMFVLTSSEEAIERREKMFRILADPSVEDLPFRRQRIVSRQSTRQPFTERFLASQLEILTGGKNRYSIKVNSEKFELNIVTQIGMQGGIDELWFMLERTVPLNMVINTKNELYAICESTVYLPTTSAYVVLYEMTHDFNAEYTTEGDKNLGTVLTGFTTMELQ